MCWKGTNSSLNHSEDEINPLPSPSLEKEGLLSMIKEVWLSYLPGPTLSAQEELNHSITEDPKPLQAELLRDEFC